MNHDAREDLILLLVIDAFVDDDLPTDESRGRRRRGPSHCSSRPLQAHLLVRRRHVRQWIQAHGWLLNAPLQSTQREGLYPLDQALHLLPRQASLTEAHEDPKPDCGME